MYGHYHDRYVRSPDGTWRIASIHLTELRIDDIRQPRRTVARRCVRVAGGSGGGVGWLAPFGQGLTGGADANDLVRLIGFDILFGAGGATIGVFSAASLGRLWDGPPRATSYAATEPARPGA